MAKFVTHEQLYTMGQDALGREAADRIERSLREYPRGKVTRWETTTTICVKHTECIGLEKDNDSN